MKKQILILKSQIEELFKDPRCEVIWNRIFKNYVCEDPNSIFYDNYEYKVWRERNLPKEKTKFGQELIKISSFDAKRLIINENEIFPHLFEFKIYLLKDDRDVDVPEIFISLIEYYGEAKVLIAKQEERIYPNSILSGNLFDLNVFLRKELNRDPDEPKYIVWFGYDPRIVEDYTSEVYESVAFIGYEDEAMDFYITAKQWRNKGSYVSFPQVLRNKKLQIGDKVITHPAKSSFSDEERWEIEKGY